MMKQHSPTKKSDREWRLSLKEKIREHSREEKRSMDQMFKELAFFSKLYGRKANRSLPRTDRGKQQFLKLGNMLKSFERDWQDDMSPERGNEMLVSLCTGGYQEPKSERQLDNLYYTLLSKKIKRESDPRAQPEGLLSMQDLSEFIYVIQRIESAEDVKTISLMYANGITLDKQARPAAFQQCQQEKGKLSEAVEQTIRKIKEPELEADYIFVPPLPPLEPSLADLDSRPERKGLRTLTKIRTRKVLAPKSKPQLHEVKQGFIKKLHRILNMKTK